MFEVCIQSILEVYFPSSRYSSKISSKVYLKYTFKVYLKYTSFHADFLNIYRSILKVYFGSVLEVYLKYT